MNTAQQIAGLFRSLYNGGNWTGVGMKQSLADVTWEVATGKISSLNTIAALVYHIDYYVRAVSTVLQKGALDAHDKYSFDHPLVQSENDWNLLLEQTWKNGEIFASLLEQMPGEQLWQNFPGEKYGNYYRNVHGVIEHTNYHLGQIVIIKKILTQASGER